MAPKKKRWTDKSHMILPATSWEMSLGFNLPKGALFNDRDI